MELKTGAVIVQLSQKLSTICLVFFQSYRVANDGRLTANSINVWIENDSTVKG